MHEPEILDRRELLQRIGWLVGAVVLPGTAVFGAQAAAKERFLSPARFDLLSAVADTILPKTQSPGALAAQVPALLDALLVEWASPARRTQLTEALERIDRLAMAVAGKAFASLSAAERHALLQRHDAAALQPAQRTDGLDGVAAFLGEPAVVDGGYSKLKELIVVLFYSSQIGLTYELTYAHAPGKWQPSVPVTADTRPAGGGGPF